MEKTKNKKTTVLFAIVGIVVLSYLLLNFLPLLACVGPTECVVASAS